MEKFNPFRPGQVVTPGMFSGRENEIQQMRRGLHQTKHGNPQNFLIEGERGIGKSSLLLYLDYIARGEIDVEGNHYNYIVLNLELRETMTSDDIIDNILSTLKREMSEREKLKELCKGAWDFLSSFEIAGVKYNKQKDEISAAKLDELTNTLRDIIKSCNDNIDGIVILIDEADRPPAAARLGELCKLITERLTRMNCEKVAFVLAGLPGLTNKVRESHESAPRVFSIIPLEPLEPDERKEVVVRGLELAKQANKFETEISEEALGLLASLSEGYPTSCKNFVFALLKKIMITKLMKMMYLKVLFLKTEL